MLKCREKKAMKKQIGPYLRATQWRYWLKECILRVVKELKHVQDTMWK